MNEPTTGSVKINRMIAVRNFAQLLHEEETFQKRYEKAIKDLQGVGFNSEGDILVATSFAKRCWAPYQPSMKELREFVERWFAYEDIPVVENNEQLDPIIEREINQMAGNLRFLDENL